MRILVTGGAGFIGSQYVRGLLAGEYPGGAGSRVTVLDKLTYAGNRENLPAWHPRLEFVPGNVCDRALLRELLPGQDAVVHFAAESHVDRSLEYADEFVQTNVGGTSVLMDTCLETGVERVVHISTDEVYGSIGHGACTEDAPLLPSSPYAASKAASDLVVLSYWRSYGLDVSITRCSNNYGPYQYPEKFISLSITNLLEGRPVPLYGDGLHVREWIHVTDHCRAVQLVLTRGRAGDIYHVGGGVARTNLAVAERLIELCDADRSMMAHVPDRKGHDRRYALDESKIRSELGYAPAVDFEKGLAETVAWYRDNSRWWKAAKDSAPL
jgi:dTDP-glucose 4,6-dehydratase